MENKDEKNNTEKIANIKKWIFIILVIGYIFYYVTPADYELYKNCKGDKEKWEKVINSLVDSAVEDIEDGVWSDSEYSGWARKRKDITNYVDNNIGDEMLQADIYQMLNTKLNNLNNEYPNIEGVREKVMKRMELMY
jgi:hypothetical protein